LASRNTLAHNSRALAKTAPDDAARAHWRFHACLHRRLAGRGARDSLPVSGRLSNEVPIRAWVPADRATADHARPVHEPHRRLPEVGLPQDVALDVAVPELTGPHDVPRRPRIERARGAAAWHFTMRPAGLSSAIDEDRIGRIYQTRGGPDSLRWFWSMTVTGPMTRSDLVATLKAAKAQFQKSWDAWKAWAKLEEAP
jgi:hypothetical protein